MRDPNPPLPTQIREPQRPPVQPTPSSGAPGVDAEPVLPDEPITTSDETDADTGDLYAGSDGETVDGYFPDAALDLVLEATRGTARVAPGIAMPVHGEGDELLAGTAHTADASLLLTTVGRLVLEADDAEYTCSGTVINSDSGLIVVTAAHCIFDDETRDYYDRITFEPGYERGDAPSAPGRRRTGGCRRSTSRRTSAGSTAPTTTAGMGFDFGFIRFAPRDGATLEDAVGGQGISFTAETNGVVIAGYPGNDEFDAEVLRYCAEDEASYGAGGDANYGAECAMGDGAWARASCRTSTPSPARGASPRSTRTAASRAPTARRSASTAYNGLRSLNG